MTVLVKSVPNQGFVAALDRVADEVRYLDHVTQCLVKEAVG